MVRGEIRVLFGAGVIVEQAVVIGRNPKIATAVLVNIVNVFVGLNRVA